MLSLKATVMVITLLAVCLLSTGTSAAFPGCCQRYTTIKIPFPLIRGYSVQTDKEFCRINAIIFHTTKGKICTDPALQWVMEYINRIRNKAQWVHFKTSKVHK